MFKLIIIIGSTRPGRVGLPIGSWFFELAEKYHKFEAQLIDLAEVNLPFLDEPNHPRMKQYTQNHTKEWSEKINSGDAFVFVTPEYNYGFPATLKNAIDYLYQEWQNKPVGFVSYGGIAAGTRAVQMLKLVVTSLNMMPIAESVNISFVKEHFTDDEEFQPTEREEKAANLMLDKLFEWANALKTLRESHSK